MTDQLKIYIDRLKDGSIEKLEMILPTEFININEPELSFPEPIKLRGKAYLADDHLLLELQIHTSAEMPCKVCNQMIECPLKIKSTHPISLDEVSSAIYDCSTLIREEILSEIPPFIECFGNCKERKTLDSYLSSEKNQDKGKFYFPFTDLGE